MGTTPCRRRPVVNTAHLLPSGEWTIPDAGRASCSCTTARCSAPCHPSRSPCRGGPRRMTSWPRPANGSASRSSSCGFSRPGQRSRSAARSPTSPRPTDPRPSPWNPGPTTSSPTTRCGCRGRARAGRHPSCGGPTSSSRAAGSSGGAPRSRCARGTSPASGGCRRRRAGCGSRSCLPSSPTRAPPSSGSEHPRGRGSWPTRPGAPCSSRRPGSRTTAPVGRRSSRWCGC